MKIKFITILILIKILSTQILALNITPVSESIKNLEQEIEKENRENFPKAKTHFLQKLNIVIVKGIESCKENKEENSNIELASSQQCLDLLKTFENNVLILLHKKQLEYFEYFQQESKILLEKTQELELNNYKIKWEEIQKSLKK